MHNLEIKAFSWEAAEFGFLDKLPERGICLIFQQEM